MTWVLISSWFWISCWTVFWNPFLELSRTSILSHFWLTMVQCLDSLVWSIHQFYKTDGFVFTLFLLIFFLENWIIIKLNHQTFCWMSCYFSRCFEQFQAWTAIRRNSLRFWNVLNIPCPHECHRWGFVCVCVICGKQWKLFLQLQEVVVQQLLRDQRRSLFLLILSIYAYTIHLDLASCLSF